MAKDLIPDDANPEAGILDHTDVVINLAAASISKWLFLGRTPWAAGQKHSILTSRIDAARTLAQAIRDAKNPPSLLIQASAVGYYGERGSEELTERSSAGEGFLAVSLTSSLAGSVSESHSRGRSFLHQKFCCLMNRSQHSTRNCACALNSN